jgi:hypothetical protein
VCVVRALAPFFFLIQRYIALLCVREKEKHNDLLMICIHSQITRLAVTICTLGGSKKQNAFYTVK